MVVAERRVGLRSQTWKHPSDLEVKQEGELPPREVGDLLPAPREHLFVPRGASRSLRQPY